MPPSTHHAALRQVVATRVEADLTDPGFPAEGLRTIEAAVRRRTIRSSTAGLGDRLRALESAADFDTGPPVASDQPGGRHVKVAVAKVTSWYVGHVAVQARDIGVATARAMRAVVARLDELDRRIGALEERERAEGQL